MSKKHKNTISRNNSIEKDNNHPFSKGINQMKNELKSMIDTMSDSDFLYLTYTIMSSIEQDIKDKENECDDYESYDPNDFMDEEDLPF